jgi:hypothetical protein
MTEGFSDSYKRILHFLECLFGNGIQNWWPKLVAGSIRRYESSKLKLLNVFRERFLLPFQTPTIF